MNECYSGGRGRGGFKSKDWMLHTLAECPLNVCIGFQDKTEDWRLIGSLPAMCHCVTCMHLKLTAWYRMQTVCGLMYCRSVRVSQLVLLKLWATRRNAWVRYFWIITVISILFRIFPWFTKEGFHPHSLWISVSYLICGDLLQSRTLYRAVQTSISLVTYHLYIQLKLGDLLW